MEGAVVIDQIKNKDDTPTMRGLNRYVVKRHAADWIDIGLELGLKYDTIKIIETNNKKVEDCFRDVLHNWLKLTPNATWRMLEVTLTNVRRQQLGLDPVNVTNMSRTSSIDDRKSDASGDSTSSTNNIHGQGSIKKLSSTVSNATSGYGTLSLSMDVDEYEKSSRTLAGHMRGIYKENKHSEYLLEKVQWPPSCVDAVVSVVMITYNKINITEKQLFEIAEYHKDGAAAVDSLVNENDQLPPGKKQRLEIETPVTKEIADIFEAYSTKEETAPPKRILIEGPPGIGKTVLAKDIAYRWSTNGLPVLEKVTILFLLFLRDPELQKIKSLEELVQYVGMGQFSDTEVTKFVSEIKAAEQVCFVLDGFDEYPEAQRERSFFIKLIYGNILSNTIIVITSRPDSTLKIRSKMDKCIVILGLSRIERDKFISISLNYDDIKIKQLESYLGRYPIINGFCHVPLYLVILLYLFQRDNLPKSLTELNKSFVFHTVYRHLRGREMISSKRVAKKLEDLTPFYPERMDQLSQVAFKGLENDKLTFTSDELGFSAVDDAQNGFGLLQAVQNYPKIGAGETISLNFLHFTIQEFLAAYYVTKLPIQEQLAKMRISFWKGRFSFMWLMYVGIVGVSNDLFVNFISNGETYKNGSGIKVTSAIQKDKRKLLQLFQCYMEAFGDAKMPKGISSLFENGEVRFSNVTLLPHHISYLTLFLSTTNVHCNTLDISSTGVDDTTLNILEHFVVDHEQNASSFEHIDISGNPSSPWSVYAAFIRCCQSSKLTLFGDYNHVMTSHLTTLRDGLQTNFMLNELSLFGISDKDLQSIKDLFCYMHTLNILNLAWKKAVDKVLIQTNYYGFSDSPELVEGKNVITVKIWNNETFSANDRYKDLSSCNIGDREIAFLAFGIHGNATLHKLNISNNKISDNGALTISSSLKENNVLQDFDISKNKLTTIGIMNILMAVKTNASLCQLNISKLDISDDCAEAICDMLKENTTLLNIDLSYNKLSCEGSVKIVNSLQNNTTLCELNISYCNLSDNGAAVLDIYLRKNILQYLNITGNGISDEGANRIAKAIKVNTSLCTLDMSDNRITSTGLLNFLNKVKKNAKLRLQYLIARHNNITKSGFNKIKECSKEMTLKVDLSFNTLILQNRDQFKNGAKTLVVVKSFGADEVICEQRIKDIPDDDYRITLVSSCLAEDKCIEDISLSKTKITSVGAFELAKALEHNSVLMVLDISKTFLSDDGIAKISESLTVNKSLEKLNVSYNEITCIGAKQLATVLAASTCKPLKSVNISNNNISDDGGSEILRSSLHLKDLDLSNIGITKNGVPELAKAVRDNSSLVSIGLFQSQFTDQSSFHDAILNAMEHNHTIKKLCLPFLHDNGSPQREKVKNLNIERAQIKIDLLSCFF